MKPHYLRNCLLSNVPNSPSSRHMSQMLTSHSLSRCSFDITVVFLIDNIVLRSWDICHSTHFPQYFPTSLMLFFLVSYFSCSCFLLRRLWNYLWYSSIMSSSLLNSFGHVCTQIALVSDILQHFSIHKPTTFYSVVVSHICYHRCILIFP